MRRGRGELAAGLAATGFFAAAGRTLTGFAAVKLCFGAIAHKPELIDQLPGRRQTAGFNESAECVVSLLRLTPPSSSASSRLGEIGARGGS